MKLSKTKYFVLYLILAVSTSLYCDSAIAGDDVACPIYGQTAVAQQEQNLKYNCGYSGPEWNSDPQYHSSWCMNVDLGLAEAGTAKRVDMLLQCSGVQYPAGADKWCNIYSILAVGQNTANLETSCGLSGPEWRSDYAYHYSWCVKVPKLSSMSGMNLRRDALMKCSK